MVATVELWRHLVVHAMAPETRSCWFLHVCVCMVSFFFFFKFKLCFLLVYVDVTIFLKLTSLTKEIYIKNKDLWI